MSKKMVLAFGISFVFSLCESSGDPSLRVMDEGR